jgi:PIN domain nuclease of toxin-antitoxin system
MKNLRVGKANLRILLDTHALLWALLEPSELSRRAKALLLDRRNELFLSSATAWEISAKFRLGKLPEAAEVATSYLEVTKKFGAEHLAISPLHSLTAGSFRVDRRDPFDRVIAAQALHENLVVVSKDEALLDFPITVIWD